MKTKKVIYVCQHSGWKPTLIAGDVYEQCVNCGEKRFRDPARREAERKAKVSKKEQPAQLTFF
jgi:DNA-directed RNA polymerase subunit RPC12/RpoP